MMTLSELAGRWFHRSPSTLTPSQHRVLQSSLERRPVARNPNETFEDRMTFGQRLADNVARLGGSWGFIICFGVFLLVWVAVNVWLIARPFDPYPFIFLNLVLSMLAAIQAPVIMMAQNRQALHDRIDASHDYEVNLKSELEIMALHDKLDQLRNEQLVQILSRIEALAEDIRRLEVKKTEADESAGNITQI